MFLFFFLISDSDVVRQVYKHTPQEGKAWLNGHFCHISALKKVEKSRFLIARYTCLFPSTNQLCASYGFAVLKPRHPTSDDPIILFYLAPTPLIPAQTGSAKTYRFS